MAQTTIRATNSSWTGTASADQVYIYAVDKARVNTGGGNDSIYNYLGWYDTVDAGLGNDTITFESGLGSSINAGDGADRISLKGGSSYVVTVKGGKGNDTTYGSGNKTLHQYANGDGYDVIYNWSANDTLSLSSDLFYSRSTVGNDVVIGLGNGAVTLKGAKGKTINLKGGAGYMANLLPVTTVRAGEYGVTVNNSLSNRTITGTAYTDSIRNTGNYVTVNAGAGNDIINNCGVNPTVTSASIGAHVSIYAGDGEDSIRNDGRYMLIDGGNGNDTLTNSDWGLGATLFGGKGNDFISTYNINAVSLNGGEGNDTIDVRGTARGVTVTGGKGNDSIKLSGGNNLVQYTSGDGNDLIYNWSANDTLKITGGNYTRSTVNNDVLVKVGNGTITLSGAKGKTVNIIGTLGGGNSNNVSIPSNAYIYNEHSYIIYHDFSSVKTWEQAKTFCEARGGHLAVINNAAENTALYNMLKRNGFSSAYIGLTDASREGTWTWVNGDTSTYRNWASGEPNGGRNENYGMFYYKYSNGQWNDGGGNIGGTGSDTKAFICEWDIVTTSGGNSNVGVTVNNSVANKLINGTAYADSIRNTGQYVTINAYDGKDTINNDYGNRSLINMGAGDDSIYGNNNYATIYAGTGNDTIVGDHSNSKLNGEAGNDLISITSYWRNTLDGGDGNDTIIAGGNEHSVSGGAGADRISLSGNKLTINGGTGNDTIYGNTTTSHLYQYVSGDGNDLIYNWSANDTLKITGGNYTRSTVNNDVLVKVGNGTITLSGAKGKTVNIIGTQATVQPVTQPSGNNIYGTNGHDSLRNSVVGKTVYALDGNDTVRNSANNVYISGGAGNDSIESYSYASNVTVNGDDGHDHIDVSGANAKIYGDNGNDYIEIVKGDNDYIDCGAGDDTVDVWSGRNFSVKGGSGNDYVILYSNASCVIVYNSGDGYDTVTSFSDNDTLKITGNYTRSTVGNDVVVKVGNGSITLKNAKGTSININGLASSYDLASSADLIYDRINSDDKNFLNDDTNLSAIIDGGTANYSAGKITSTYNLTSLMQKDFVTFVKK